MGNSRSPITVITFSKDKTDWHQGSLCTKDGIIPTLRTSEVPIVWKHEDLNGSGDPLDLIVWPEKSWSVEYA